MTVTTRALILFEKYLNFNLSFERRWQLHWYVGKLLSSFNTKWVVPRSFDYESVSIRM